MNHSKIILDKITIDRNYPLNISEGDKLYFDQTKSGESKPTEIKIIENVSVNNELFIKSGLGIHIYMESFGDYWQDGKYNRPLYQAKSFIKNLLRKNKLYKEILWCFDQYSTGGYFHWITEISPRLWLAKEYVDASVPLLIPAYFRNKWKFSDAFLNVFNRRLLEFHESELAVIDKMNFIGQTGGPLNYQPHPLKESTQYLIDFYYDSDYSNTSISRIYISRKKTGKRMILNELAVEDVLSKYGYRTMVLEEMSVYDQVNLFVRATHVVSIHGAGLANMVFMKPESSIIEIRHKVNSHMLSFFYTLAHTFQHKYYYLFGDIKGDGPLSEIRLEDKSIHADISTLQKVLLQVHASDSSNEK